jgi:hypothetical protein
VEHDDRGTILGSLRREYLEGSWNDSLWATIKDLGAVVGIDEHGWSLETATDTWTENLEGLGALAGRDADTGRWFQWDLAGEAWTGLGKEFIAYDVWAQDPSRAWGRLRTNIGLLFIPGAGAVHSAEPPPEMSATTRSSGVSPPTVSSRIFEASSPAASGTG